jgi:hypothetical protein
VPRVPTAAMMMPIMEPVFRPESELEDEDGFGDDAEVGVEAEEGAAPALYVLSVAAPVGKSAQETSIC